MAEYIDKWSVINRLIDLENEFQQYKPFHGFERAMYRKICEAEIAIGKMPAADVAPVRHGQWIEPSRLYYGAKQYECSLCYSDTFWKKHSITEKYPHCPNCGCRMDGGDEE